MTEMTQAEVDEAITEAEQVDGWPATCEVGTWAAIARRLARAVRHLAARQMPALRWEENSCRLGKIEVGFVTKGVRGLHSRVVWESHVSGEDDYLTDCATEPEARTAVEAAVRERLGMT